MTRENQVLKEKQARNHVYPPARTLSRETLLINVAVLLGVWGGCTYGNSSSGQFRHRVIAPRSASCHDFGAGIREITKMLGVSSRADSSLIHSYTGEIRPSRAASMCS